jgi:hypothetical protein
MSTGSWVEIFVFPFESAQPGAPWSIPDKTLKTSLYSEDCQTATFVGHRGARGQDRPTGPGVDPLLTAFELEVRSQTIGEAALCGQVEVFAHGETSVPLVGMALSSSVAAQR